MDMDVLRSMVGIHVFPVISLVMFVAVFAVVLGWAVRADRAALDRHAAIPLDGSPSGSRFDGADRRSL